MSKYHFYKSDNIEFVSVNDTEICFEEHCHTSDFVITLVVKGDATLKKEKAHVLHTNDIFIILPYEAHSLISDKKISLISMCIKKQTVYDYCNWKTRKIIGIRTEAAPEEWFFSVHYGWWNDPEEPFQGQWRRTVTALANHRRVWLMGDFNSPAEVRGEGYDMIRNDGWFDSYPLAKHRDSGITVGNVIDGWKDKISDTNGMRIDQIWCSEKPKIISSEVIFNGENRKIVSDHYGVIVNYERSDIQ